MVCDMKDICVSNEIMGYAGAVQSAGVWSANADYETETTLSYKVCDVKLVPLLITWFCYRWNCRW